MFGKKGGDKQTKKEAIRKNNRKLFEIAVIREKQEEQREKAQEESDLYLDADRQIAKETARLAGAQQSRADAMRARLIAGRTRGEKRWTVAATSSGSFMTR